VAVLEPLPAAAATASELALFLVIKMVVLETLLAVAVMAAVLVILLDVTAAMLEHYWR